MTSSDAPRRHVGPPLAYRNTRFLESHDARPIRILSEYLQPMHAFRKKRVRGTVVIFGSARVKPDGPFQRYYDDARELARLLTVWSRSQHELADRFLVCTGGGPGIMEAANRGAMEAGGR